MGDEIQVFHCICKLAINDRSLPDILILIGFLSILIGGDRELFLLPNLIRFEALLLVEVENTSLGQKFILSFQLKSAFSTLIVHTVIYFFR